MILLFSPADTDLLTALAADRQRPAGTPAIQALQLNDYQEPEALDRLFASLPQPPLAVVLRLLGGKSLFARGFEWLKARCQTDGIAFLPLPGDPQPDPELSAEGSLPLRISGVVFDYLIRGGVLNFVNLAGFLVTGMQWNRADRRTPARSTLGGCVSSGCASGGGCRSLVGGASPARGADGRGAVLPGPMDVR